MQISKQLASDRNLRRLLGRPVVTALRLHMWSRWGYLIYNQYQATLTRLIYLFSCACRYLVFFAQRSATSLGHSAAPPSLLPFDTGRESSDRFSALQCISRAKRRADEIQHVVSVSSVDLKAIRRRCLIHDPLLSLTGTPCKHGVCSSARPLFVASVRPSAF